MALRHRVAKFRPDCHEPRRESPKNQWHWFPTRSSHDDFARQRGYNDQELQLIGSILYYICSVHRINPRLESAFGTYHNLIKYIWIIQSNPIPSDPIWSKIICMLRDLNLRASALCCHAADHWAILPWCKFPVAQIYCMIPKGAKDLPNESKNKFCCVCTTRACVNNFLKFPNQIYISTCSSGASLPSTFAFV